MFLDPLSYRLFKNAGNIPASQGRGPIVLMYHSIEPFEKKCSSIWAVSAKAFASQMKLLKKEGWKTCLFRDLLNAENLPAKSVVITFDDGFEDNFEYGYKVLRDLGMCATWFIVSGEMGGESVSLDPNEEAKPMLHPNQIIEMAAAGMEIGSHTRTHASLPELDIDRIDEEVSGSKKDLEEFLGQTITSFAYPFGRYNATCLERVRSAGFLIACTTETGWFGSQKNLFKVRRTPVFSFDSLGRFARKIAFADPEVGWSKTGKYLAQRVMGKIFS